MPKHKSVAYTKIGTHRGKRRLWLEGRKLSRAGVEPGRRFSVKWDRDSKRVILKFDEEGDRVVSKRKRGDQVLPVIDVNTGTLEDTLGVAIERAKITIEPDEIVVAIHPDDEAAIERIERLVNKVKSGEEIETGSLAHGGGILDNAIHEGLRDKGLRSRLAFAVELDQPTLETSERNNDIWDDETLMVEGPMEEVDTSDLPKVDLLVAGLPCVGASRSGKAKNRIAEAEQHPKAGALFVSALQVIKATNPSIVVLENVPDYSTSATGEVLRSCLRTWGYDVHETILNGNDMGALELRRRMCMVGASKGLDIDLEKLVAARMKEATMSEILEDIPPDDPRWKEYGYLIEKAERDKESGKNFQMQVLAPEAERCTAIGAGYYKVRSTEPKIMHPDDPKKMRQLTPGEHAAVKTIPRHLVEDISGTLAHKIMGNSVIWTAWRSVSNHLADAMLDTAGVTIDEGDADEIPTLLDLMERHDVADMVEINENVIAQSKSPGMV